MPGGFSAALEEEGTLKRVLTDFEVPPSPLHAVFPPGPHLAPRVRAFVDLLSSKLEGGISFPAKRRT